MTKYYAGVVVKQAGRKNNTYHFPDTILADEKGGIVAASPNEANKSNLLTATTPSVIRVLRLITKYNGQNGQNAENRTLFQMKEEVEQVKDLIAVHNRNVSALIQGFKQKS